MHFRDKCAEWNIDADWAQSLEPVDDMEGWLDSVNTTSLEVGDDFLDTLGLEDSDISLSKYHAKLREAEAYQWLLSAIRAGFSLETRKSEICLKRVGDDILQKLTLPRRVSRAACYGLSMGFVVEWDPYKFSDDQEYSHSLDHVLEHAVTLTGCSNNLQAVTCGEYMRQCWPRTGPWLLEFLQRTLVNTTASYQDTFPDKTRLAAYHADSRLYLHATGNTSSVAEIGDQIAWIGAALRSSPYPEEAVYSSAHLRDLAITATADSHHMFHGSCLLAFDIQQLPDSDVAGDGGCWRGMFRNPVIVKGYPIPRRSRPNTGLEIPLYMVAALTNCQRVMSFAGITFLKGFAAMLYVHQDVGGFIYWHLCYNPKGEYISYADPRVLRGAANTVQKVGLDTMKMRRHIVGWTDNARNFTGSADANYAIEWTNLPPPDAKCVLEKVTVTGSGIPIINLSTSILLGVKDKPLHVGFANGYMELLQAIGERSFVLYEPEERRAWLVDGASAALHVLRAYLKSQLDDSRVRKYIRYSDGDIDEKIEPDRSHSGAEAAFDILLNPENQTLPIHAKAPSQSEETLARLGSKHDSDSKTIKTVTSHFTLKERVEQICHVLLLMAAYYDDVSAQSGYGWRLANTLYHRIEGFEFMDVATSYGTLHPKVATIHKCSIGWVHFIRALRAIPLFGVGFGDLIRPAATGAPCCASTSLVPIGRDFLAVYGADLERILRKGSMRRKPWRLTGNIHWHSPGGKAFEPCKCEGKAATKGKEQCSSGWPLAGRKRVNTPTPADLVQVILPGNFPQLYGRELRSPERVISRGAVLFGHSMLLPLRWSSVKNEPPEECDPEPISVDDVTELVDDSGIGTSNDLSSGQDSPGPSSFYALGGNPGFTGTLPNYLEHKATSSEDVIDNDAVEQIVPLTEGNRKRLSQEQGADSEHVGKVRRVDEGTSC